MEFSLFALIGISLATMFFGYFFGLFEGRGQGYKKGRKEEAEVRAIQPPPAEHAASHSAPLDRSRLLSLGRDEAGQTTVQVDGKSVAASNVTPEVRKRLIDLMVMLRPWVDPSASSSRPFAENMPFDGSAAASASRQVDTPTTGIAATGGAPASTSAGPALAPASLSLVQQIDLVLQDRLAGTPLANRGIRLAEALHGGAIVFIGQTQYEGVDKVPDEAIRSEIRAAIADWEKRYTPG